MTLDAKTYCDSFVVLELKMDSNFLK